MFSVLSRIDMVGNRQVIQPYQASTFTLLILTSTMPFERRKTFLIPHPSQSKRLTLRNLRRLDETDDTKVGKKQVSVGKSNHFPSYFFYPFFKFIAAVSSSQLAVAGSDETLIVSEYSSTPEPLSEDTDDFESCQSDSSDLSPHHTFPTTPRMDRNFRPTSLCPLFEKAYLEERGALPSPSSLPEDPCKFSPSPIHDMPPLNW